MHSGPYPPPPASSAPLVVTRHQFLQGIRSHAVPQRQVRHGRAPALWRSLGLTTLVNHRQQLNQVTVPVTHNHVQVVDRACDHARALAEILADIDWDLLRHPAPPEPEPQIESQGSRRRVTFFTLGSGRPRDGSMSTLPRLEESKALPAPTGAPPGSPHDPRLLGAGGEGGGAEKSGRDEAGTDETGTDETGAADPAQAGSDAADAPQSNPNVPAVGTSGAQHALPNGDANASSGSLTALGAPWWSSADQAGMAVPKPVADSLPQPSPPRGLGMVRAGSKRLPPIDRPGGDVPARMPPTESHMSLLSVTSSTGPVTPTVAPHVAAATPAAAAPAAVSATVAAPVVTSDGTSAAPASAVTPERPARSTLGLVGERIAALEAELSESKEGISLQPATPHTPIPRARVTVRQLDDAVKQYLSEYVALSSVLDYVRNALKTEVRADACPRRAGLCMAFACTLACRPCT